jgi:hypothetical protein
MKNFDKVNQDNSKELRKVSQLIVLNASDMLMIRGGEMVVIPPTLR